MFIFCSILLLQVLSLYSSKQLHFHISSSLLCFFLLSKPVRICFLYGFLTGHDFHPFLVKFFLLSAPSNDISISQTLCLTSSSFPLQLVLVYCILFLPPKSFLPLKRFHSLHYSLDFLFLIPFIFRLLSLVFTSKCPSYPLTFFFCCSVSSFFFK